MSTKFEPRGNGQAEADLEDELDRLVDEELAGIPPSSEEPVEEVLARLAHRLRERPDRAALLDRLRREVLPEKTEATEEMTCDNVPPAKE
jgi:hypothetical protein